MAYGREWKDWPYAPDGTPQGSLFQVDANGQLAPIDLTGIADGWTIVWDAGSGLFVVAVSGIVGNVWSVTAVKTANYTAAAKEFVPCDASSGAFTVTLPAPTAGTVVQVKKMDANANPVTVDGAGSDLIDGGLTYVLTTQHESASFIANGTGWMVY